MATKINRKVLLSALWLVATLNYIYADVMALMDAEILADLIEGTAGGGIQVTEGLLLGSAALYGDSNCYGSPVPGIEL